MFDFSAIKDDNQRWKQRVTQLIEKHQKISPEEMRKVQIEKAKLQETLTAAQGSNKQLSLRNNAISNQLKTANDKVANLTKEKDEEIRRLNNENNSCKLANNQNVQKVNKVRVLLHPMLESNYISCWQ